MSLARSVTSLNVSQVRQFGGHCSAGGGVFVTADMLPGFARDIVRVVRNTADCGGGGGGGGKSERERREVGSGMSGVVPVARIWKSEGMYG